METYENGIHKIQKKDFVKIGRWDYCFGHGNEIPDGYGIACADFHKRLEEENPDPLPFVIINYDYVAAQAGSDKGRMWVSIRGNIHSSYLLPRHVVKSTLQYQYFPPLTPIAVRDVANRYAPGTFGCKFPNDVICKEHGCKCAGCAAVPTPKFLSTGFAFNLVASPPGEYLREKGLKACCLKNHTENSPTPEKFLTEVGERVLELIEQIGDDVDKFVTIFNEAFNVFEKKHFKFVVNNPKADIDKDGFIWSKELPNALLKGFLNDVEFDIKDPKEWPGRENFWTMVRYKIKQSDDPDYKDIQKKIKEYEDKVNKK